MLSCILTDNFHRNAFSAILAGNPVDENIDDKNRYLQKTFGISENRVILDYIKDRIKIASAKKTVIRVVNNIICMELLAKFYVKIVNRAKMIIVLFEKSIPGLMDKRKIDAIEASSVRGSDESIEIGMIVKTDHAESMRGIPEGIAQLISFNVPCILNSCVSCNKKSVYSISEAFNYIQAVKAPGIGDVILSSSSYESLANDEIILQGNKYRRTTLDRYPGNFLRTIKNAYDFYEGRILRR
jgi:chorismate synthase